MTKIGLDTNSLPASTREPLCEGLIDGHLTALECEWLSPKDKEQRLLIDCIFSAEGEVLTHIRSWVSSLIAERRKASADRF